MNAWLQPTSFNGHRCWWPGVDVRYQEYHDTEWGRPVTEDEKLFEKLCLEGFQAGLSWLTILRKRENFRRAFAAFDIETVSRFGDSDVNRLMSDAGIVRHRGKIEAVINNAICALDLLHEKGSIAEFIWSFAPSNPLGRDGQASHPSGLATTSPSATALSKELKKRGWKFVGPTTVYSFMQSMGLINDHVDGCFVKDECERMRQAVHAHRMN